MGWKIIQEAGVLRGMNVLAFEEGWEWGGMGRGGGRVLGVIMLESWVNAWQFMQTTEKAGLDKKMFCSVHYLEPPATSYWTLSDWRITKPSDSWKQKDAQDSFV